MTSLYEITENPNDPCSLCVQWRCPECKQMDCVDDCPNWPGAMVADYEPFWPDGSIAPRIYRYTHRECQQAVDAYIADHAEDADHQ